MKVSGFTFVRNGLQLDYPFLESIRSLLPLVDELIINVPRSDDGTLAAITAVESDKIVVFESDWDESLRDGGKILSLQTNRALERCSGDWAFYLQADEVIHEQDYPGIIQAMERFLPDKTIDGISFRYYHFEGGYDWINPFRYRRQVRIVRNDGTNRSWGDACGFRKSDDAKLSTRPIPQHIYHYGWVRPPAFMLTKNRELEKLYHDDRYIENKYGGREVHVYADMDLCRRFTGSHPEVMSQRIAACDWEVAPPATSMPYALRAAVWTRLMKKWGLFR